MNTVKIVSDPYRRSIHFETREGSEWVRITKDIAPHAKLLQRDIVTGFFPFKLRKILDVIIEEYGTSKGKVAVVFEGSPEEYRDIVELCESEYHDRIDLERSSRHLNYASDAIVVLKHELHSLTNLFDANLADSPTSSKEIARLKSYVENNVTVCVFGHQDEGANRFVNALVGHELLPDHLPCDTTIVIEDNSDSNRASLMLPLEDGCISLELDASGLCDYKLEDAIDRERETKNLEALAEHLREIEGYLGCLRYCLDLLVAKSNAVETESGMPVADGAVIRLRIPLKSMADLTLCHCSRIIRMPESLKAFTDENGQSVYELIGECSSPLPIFVCSADSLGSDYYMELLNSTRQSKTMDMRFAMIVIDETDWSDLPKAFNRKFETSILNRPLPKAMGGQGVFFTSTLMGLGAKLDGNFREAADVERYQKLSAIYTDDSAGGCLRLWNYNIQPDVIKKKSADFAISLPDSVLSNSGFASVEHAIEEYGTSYAPFGECGRFESLLSKVNQQVNEVIDKRKWSLFQSKYKLEQEIPQMESEVNKKLSDCERDCWWSSFNSFTESLSDTIEWDNWKNSLQELARSYTSLLQEIVEKNEIDSHGKETQKAIENVSDKFFKRIRDAGDNQDPINFAKAFSKLYDDLSAALNQADSLNNLKSRTASETASTLYERFVEKYRHHAGKAQEFIDQASNDYWQSCARDLENRFAEVIQAYTPEYRMKLAGLFPTLYLPNLNYAVDIRDFKNMDNFIIGIHVFGLNFPTSENLDLQLLDDTYNRQMHGFIQACIRQAKVKHGDAFSHWAYLYLDKVEDNLEAIDRAIAIKLEEISNLSSEINRLTECLEHMSSIVRCVHNYLAWQS